MSKLLPNDSALGHLMDRNLLEVWGQRDAERRKVAISQIYTEDCRFFEAGQPVVTGRDDLNKSVGNVLEGTPGFVFRAAGPAQVNHDHGRLRWESGPPGAAPVISGMDVAIFDQGRIRALYTFLDSPPSK